MVEETTAAAHGLAGESEELGRLVARYKIRQTADDALRAELKKAAPHAFREPARTAAPGAMAQARAKPEPVRRPTSKAVANGSGSRVAAGASKEWQEF
jgi:methyl-accepting chemotaxis protein